MSFFRRLEIKGVSVDAENAYNTEAEGSPSVCSIPIRVDMCKHSDTLHAYAQLPGVVKETLQVVLAKSGKELTLSGVKCRPSPEGSVPILSEGLWGEFNRVVRFPGMVASGTPEATMENGVLHLTIPVTEVVEQGSGFKKRF